MPRPRFLKLPEARRHEILDAAARHFAVDGYDGASLNRILADCGLSKGAAYYYFDDKADLFATVVERSVEVVFSSERIDLEALDAQCFWPVLEGLYRRQLRTFRDRPYLFRVAKLAGSTLDHPSDGERLRARLLPLLGLFEGLLQRGFALGVFRDDLPVELLVAMLGGLDDAIDTWFLAHLDVITEPDGGPLVTAAYQSLRNLLQAREPS